MPPKAAIIRKRKQSTVEEPDAVVSNSNDDDQSKRKARRVSTDAQEATVASDETTEEAPTANATAASTEHEVSIQSIGALVQDLFQSDNAKINATLAALFLDLDNDKKKCESFVTAGGCLALVLLLKKCLDKAIDRIPACDQVTEVNEFAEVKTLHKTLRVITNLTFHHDGSIVGIAAIGGVEVVVKVMKAFPKCQVLQERACRALLNLTACNIGEAKAIESDGFEVALAAINNHLDSALLCEKACWALGNIVEDSKENTGLLITLGGGAAVAKVRRKWTDNDEIQTQVRRLANCFVAEWKACADEE
jgi:hypothetical protein